MKNLKATLFLLIAVFSTSTLSKVNVGLVKLNLKDEQRMAWDGQHLRPITVHVFYPTYDIPSVAIKLGEPEKLVKKGYLVVGVNHHGNTAIEPQKYAEGFVLWWERSRDIAVVLDKISKDKKWSKYIESTQIGMLGFSLGGYTTIATIGGITDKALFAKFCASEKRDFTCDAQAELPNIEEKFNKVKHSNIVRASLERQHNSYKIEQIKAAFILSPAVVQSITEDSLREITVPVSVIVGTQDTVAPAASNAKRVASLVSGAGYAEIQGAGHYTFLSECTDLGKTFVQNLCTDMDNIDRAKVHDKVSEQALSFFDHVFSYNTQL